MMAFHVPTATIESQGCVPLLCRLLASTRQFDDDTVRLPAEFVHPCRYVATHLMNCLADHRVGKHRRRRQRRDTRGNLMLLEPHVVAVRSGKSTGTRPVPFPRPLIGRQAGRCISSRWMLRIPFAGLLLRRPALIFRVKVFHVGQKIANRPARKTQPFLQFRASLPGRDQPLYVAWTQAPPPPAPSCWRFSSFSSSGSNLRRARFTDSRNLSSPLPNAPP